MRTTSISTPDGLAMHVRVHGERGDRAPLLCLHGLTRNARDFDALAAAIAPSRQVIAPDLRGRGRSDYDPEWRHYVPPVYADDIFRLLDALELPHAAFCGTSLGGLVTMLVAQRDPSRVAAAILNDIGPVIEAEGLARIQQYAGQLPPVVNREQALAQLRFVYDVTMPNASDADWQALFERSYRDADDVPVLDFDPAIGRAIREVDMQLGDPWQLFDALHDIPTLVLRGALSDILSEQTVDAMQARGRDVQRATIADRGHAPWLDEADSINAIRQFLSELP